MRIHPHTRENHSRQTSGTTHDGLLSLPFARPLAVSMIGGILTAGVSAPSEARPGPERGRPRRRAGWRRR